MSRKQLLAYSIAKFLVNPVDGIEIGGVSDQLVGIVRTMTKNNASLRQAVLDWLCFFCESDDRLEKLRNEYDRFYFQC